MQKRFRNKLRQIGRVNPSQKFREKVKNNIYLKSLEKNKTLIHKIFPFIPVKDPRKAQQAPLLSFMRGFAFTGALSVFLIFIGGFFLYSIPTSAGEKTYIEDIKGVVEVSDNGSDFYSVEVEDILGSGDILRTGEDSSASVVFFEDSVLRLDSNTRVKIKNLVPHPIVSDVGTVAIEVDFGRIWLKTLGEKSDYTGIEVYSGDLMITPENSAFDLERNGNINIVRMFERSSRVSYRGERNRKSIILIAGKEVRSTLLGLGEIQKITNEEKTEEWVQVNIALDQKYIDNFIDKETEYLESSFAKLKENVSLTFQSETGEKYLALAKRDFYEALLAIKKGEIEKSEQDFDNFFSNLNKAVELDPSLLTVVELELQKGKKYLQFSTPNDEFFPAKKAIEEALENFSTDPVAVKARATKETLWEVHSLASTDNRGMAEAHLETFTEELQALSEEEIVLDPEIRAEMLDQKSEELEILSELQEEILPASKVAEEAEDELISEVVEASLPVRAGFPGSQPVEKKTTEAFVEKVNIYSTDKGQENALRQVLQDIPNDVSSLETLKELKGEVPVHLRRMVVEKIVEITRIERQKALLEAS